MFQVFASTPEAMGPGEIGAYAARAEAMGYDGLQVPDALHDGLLLAALALNATRTLMVGTGVLVAFARSPMTVAIASWDLQKMSAGRFELGLGTQVKANIEQRYSARWDSPVPQLREYVQALQAIFHSFQSGEKLHFVGSHYQFTKLQPFFNPGPIEYPQPPIFCGAVGPDMTRMVARFADGMITHPTNTAPEYIRQVCLPRLRSGLAEAGRDAADFKLLLAPLVATGNNDAEIDAAWEKQRGLLGFLFSTPAYWPSLEFFGCQDRGQQLLELTRSGDWAGMAQVLDDALLDKLVPRGSYAEIAAVLRHRYTGLSRRITFPMPTNPADDGAAAQAIARLRE